MPKNAFSTVITVNPGDSHFAFYSCVGGDKNSIKHTVKGYKSRYFDEEFFSEFARCLREYSNANPAYAGKSAFVTVLLPNHLISTNSFNIPGMNKKNTDSLFKVAAEGTFANIAELKMNNFTVKQNKQYSTIAVAVLRQKLIQDVYTACASANMFASVITYKAASAGYGAVTLSPKLKNDTFILLDIRETESTISFVTKGITLGCIDLPFGHRILEQDKLVSENMLFPHDVAELAVLNAKEKAKAKQLTMMGGDAAVDAAQEAAAAESDTLLTSESPEPAVREIASNTIKTLPKKTPRVLPKWMQRPLPDSHEGFVYENFRIFEKYALEFIRANSRLTAIAAPSMVYVNMPEEYGFLYKKVNEEESENGIRFSSLGIRKEKPVIADCLDLYGGLFADMFTPLNNF